MTGILGDTYPKELPPKGDQEASLSSDSTQEGAGQTIGTVSMEGEDLDFKPAPPLKRRQRGLLQAPDSDGVFTAHLGMGGGLW